MAMALRVILRGKVSCIVCDVVTLPVFYLHFKYYRTVLDAWSVSACSLPVSLSGSSGSLGQQHPAAGVQLSDSELYGHPRAGHATRSSATERSAARRVLNVNSISSFLPAHHSVVH